MEFDFSTSGTVDTLDNVPEQFRGVYVEDPATKKFNVNPTLKGVVDAITGLNTALRSERGTTKTLKSQKDVAAVVKEVFGLDTVEEVKAKIDELNQQVAEKSKVDPAKIKADIEKAFTTKEEGYKGTISKMQGTLEKYLIDSAATGALSAAKGNVKLLLPIIRNAVAVVPDGDDYVVRVKDPAGDYRGNGAGGFMSIEDLVKELKSSADYKVAFESDAPSGGGGNNRQQQPSRQTQQRETQRQTQESTNPTDRIAAGLAKRRGGR